MLLAGVTNVPLTTVNDVIKNQEAEMTQPTAVVDD